MAFALAFAADLAFPVVPDAFDDAFPALSTGEAPEILDWALEIASLALAINAETDVPDAAELDEDTPIGAIGGA